MLMTPPYTTSQQKISRKALKFYLKFIKLTNLKLNVGKTETMIYNCQTAAYPESTVSLNDKLIANNETLGFWGV